MSMCFCYIKNENNQKFLYKQSIIFNNIDFDCILYYTRTRQ